MKTLIWYVCLFALITTLGAQELRLMRGNEPFVFVKKAENIWVTRIDAQEYYLIPKSDVDKMSKIIEQDEARLKRHETVLASQESLINNYEAYQQAADAHIQKQQELLVVADSLYVGYQSIYRDLKQLFGLPRIYFDTGLGFLNCPRNEKRLAGSLGIGFGNVHANALIGDGLWGATVGIRWPIRFKSK